MSTGIGKTYASVACSIALMCSIQAAGQPLEAEFGKSSQAQVVPLSPEELYRGWLASEILGQEAVSRSGTSLGRIRNIQVSSETAQIDALIIEAPATKATEDFVFRVPWQKIDAGVPHRVMVDIAHGRMPEYDLFAPGLPESTANAFSITAVIGEHVRLQTGSGYGYLRDAVFTPTGVLRAVLVTRRMELGGGTVAFGFPASPSERWRASTAYYGLPYITSNQANDAAVEVNLKRFAPIRRGSRG
jgi:sporulation protein YlmC with PRC-barrel domain